MKNSFFRTINDNEIKNNIAFKRSDYEPSYEIDSKNIPLRIEEKDNAWLISDDARQWDISVNGLILKFIVSINNTKILFGPNGVCDEDSILGIGVICTSTISDRLEAFPLCVFTAENNNITADCTINLLKGKIRGNAILRTVLYLVKSGKTESPMPKNSGTILGDLDEITIKLFENNTLFPTYEVEKPGMPLWWVKAQWSDIELDSFSQENVAVIINKSSKDYSQISIDGGDGCISPILLAEIMSSAISIIIEKIRSNADDYEKITSDSSYQRGSIAYVVQYMRDTLGFDLSTPESLAYSIREYVYSKMRLI